VREPIRAQRVVVIDEIGPMEIRSAICRDVMLIEVRPDNRARLVSEL
jgi:nucleoside-triphosphatase THEP1